MATYSLTIIIPAYNEEKTIAACIAATEAALEKYVGDYEIIVVNDASRDRTKEILDALPKSDRVHIVHNVVNRNSGYNMRLGVSMAAKEYVLNPVNADNYPNDETYRKVFECIGTKDVVLGYLVGYGD